MPCGWSSYCGHGGSVESTRTTEGRAGEGARRSLPRGRSRSSHPPGTSSRSPQPRGWRRLGQGAAEAEPRGLARQPASVRKAGEVAELLELGRELRAAQEEMLAGSPDRGEAARKRRSGSREAVDSLTRAAEAIGREHGVGAQILDPCRRDAAGRRRRPRGRRGDRAGSRDPRAARGIRSGWSAPRRRLRAARRKGGKDREAADRRARQQQAKRRKAAERKLAATERAARARAGQARACAGDQWRRRNAACTTPSSTPTPRAGSWTRLA